MQPVIDTSTEHTIANLVFADGVRRVVLVIDRVLARERLAPAILGHAAARADSADTLESRVAEVAESLGWSVRAERGAHMNVLTVGVA